jgi:hypothetical protein
MKHNSIFFWAFVIVILSSIQTYLIAQKLIILAIIQGITYSTAVVIVTPKICFATKRDKVIYVIGATCGNIVALLTCYYLLK